MIDPLTLLIIEVLLGIVVVGLGAWLGHLSTDLKTLRAAHAELEVNIARDHPDEDRMRRILADVLEPLRNDIAAIKVATMHPRRGVTER